jgi:hypothetical protein
VIRFDDEAPQVCTPIGTERNGRFALVELTVADVPVSVRDINRQASYSISGRELLALVHSAHLQLRHRPDSPSAAASDFCSRTTLACCPDRSTGALIQPDR